MDLAMDMGEWLRLNTAGHTEREREKKVKFDAVCIYTHHIIQYGRSQLEVLN